MQKSGCVLNQWRNTVDNRQEWRQLIYHKCEKVNQKRIGDYERKRESRTVEGEKSYKDNEQ